MAKPRRQVAPKNLPSSGRPNTGRGKPRQSLLSPSRWAEIDEAWRDLSAPPAADAPYTYGDTEPEVPVSSQFPPAPFINTMATPGSSRVSAIAYYDDRAGGPTYIYVRFKNERPRGSATLYRYDAQYGDYLAFVAAPSKGKHVNAVLNHMNYAPEYNPPTGVNI